MALLRILTSLAAGLLFGLGLAISGLINPAKVKAFLDIAGDWDPSLIFVLGAGVIVTFIGYRLAFALNKPLLDDRLHLPARKEIDLRLVAGSAIFGVGWALVGFCPGPSIAALSISVAPVAFFVVAMVAGMAAHDRFFTGRR